MRMLFHLGVDKINQEIFASSNPRSQYVLTVHFAWQDGGRVVQRGTNGGIEIFEQWEAYWKDYVLLLASFAVKKERSL